MFKLLNNIFILKIIKIAKINKNLIKIIIFNNNTNNIFNINYNNNNNSIFNNQILLI